MLPDRTPWLPHCRHGFPFNCPVCAYNLHPRVIWEADLEREGFRTYLDEMCKDPAVKRIFQIIANRIW